MLILVCEKLPEFQREFTALLDDALWSDCLVLASTDVAEADGAPLNPVTAIGMILHEVVGNASEFDSKVGQLSRAYPYRLAWLGFNSPSDECTNRKEALLSSSIFVAIASPYRISTMSHSFSAQGCRARRIVES